MPAHSRKILVQHGSRFRFEDFARLSKYQKLQGIRHGDPWVHRTDADEFHTIDADGFCGACRATRGDSCSRVRVVLVDLTHIKKPQGVMARKIPWPLAQALRRERRSRIPRALKDRARQVFSDDASAFVEECYESARRDAAKIFKFDKMIEADAKHAKSLGRKNYRPEPPLVIIAADAPESRKTRMSFDEIVDMAEKNTREAKKFGLTEKALSRYVGTLVPIVSQKLHRNPPPRTDKVQYTASDGTVVTLHPDGVLTCTCPWETEPSLAEWRKRPPCGHISEILEYLRAIERKQRKETKETKETIA